MSNTFKTTALAGDRVLVTGQSDGVSQKIVLDGSEWAAIKRTDSLKAAAQTFDASVEQFFAPLTDAAEAVAQAAKVEIDPAFYVVEQEATTAVHAQREVLRHLELDTVILRLIESGHTDRLIWIDNTIEVLAEGVVAPESEDIADQSHGTFEVEVGKAPVTEV